VPGRLGGARDRVSSAAGRHRVRDKDSGEGTLLAPERVPFQGLCRASLPGPCSAIWKMADSWIPPSAG